MSFKAATADDSDNLYNLINEAYRGGQGWTKETAIVAGERLSKTSIDRLIIDPNVNFLVVTLNERLAACICIEEKQQKGYLGTFAVEPSFQNKGIGKQVLQLAEDFAISKLGVAHLIMVVISQREELIAYYERRGYQRSGNISEYPVDEGVGIPIKDGLTIETLEKFVK